jgi:hypothetical protein
MPTRPHEELESRRIILLRVSKGQNPKILLGLEGAHHTLPQVQIARWQRVAEQLAAAFKQMCGLDVVSVCSLETHTVESGSEQISYEVMEPYRPQDEALLSQRWLSVDSLDESEFHDRNDFQGIRRAVAQLNSSAEDALSRPFARLGWFGELELWVQEQIARRGLHLSGEFRQLNASPTFSLIRFETNGPAVWFKATGEPNLQEFRLTQTLCELFPRYLPPLAGTRPEWNGWLALEVEGTHPDGASEPTTWFAAARELADLQVASSGKGALLVAIGARDLRIPALRSRVEPFFNTMDDLMEQQTKIRPRALSRIELRDLAARILEALDILDETRFPTTLGHLDLNPGNIVCSARGSVFLDWAEGFLGHPFLTFEYLLEHFRRSGASKAQEADIRAYYSVPWRTFVSDNAIHRATETAPLAAVFAYAARNELWNKPRAIEDRQRAASLRSLVRRMDREAQELAERSLQCRS